MPMHTGSRVLVETTRGLPLPGTRILVETSAGVLTAGTVRFDTLTRTRADGIAVQLDGELRVDIWHASQVIDPADAIEIAQGDCDECGKPEHGGECEQSWVDSNETLGLSYGAGSY